MFDLHKTLCTLAALLMLAVASPLASAHEADDHAAAPAEKTPPVKTTLKIGKHDTVIHVDDMHCKSCAKKIARKLYAVKGVVKVRSDVKADLAVVTPQAKKTLSVKSLWSASKKAGFPPVKLVGPSGTYTYDAKTKSLVRATEEAASKQADAPPAADAAPTE